MEELGSTLDLAGALPSITKVEYLTLGTFIRVEYLMLVLGGAPAECECDREKA